MTFNNLNSDSNPNSTKRIIWNGQQTIKEMAAKWLLTTISSNSFLDIPIEEFDKIKQDQRQICKAPSPSEYLD